MEWINSEWLALIGAVALGVYLYCSFAEQREKRNSAESQRQERRRDEARGIEQKNTDGGWRRLALAETLKNVCIAHIENDRIYIFINNERQECRWSCNAFCLDGEKEICTIEPGGAAKLMRHLLQYGTLVDMADAILDGYIKKHGGI